MTGSGPGRKARWSTTKRQAKDQVAQAKHSKANSEEAEKGTEAEASKEPRTAGGAAVNGARQGPREVLN